VAQIPGIPTLDPVEKPREDPRQAGKVGAAIGDFGDTSLDIVNHIREAQKQVDMLAARNDLNAAFTATQNQLMKTQNSRDVAGVIQQGKDSLNEISAKWGQSPAAIAIQMDADSLHPSLDHVGTVKQVDLMSKEGKIQLTQAAQTFAQDYAKSRGMGDAAGEQNALAAYTQSVNSLVKTGLMGDAEAKDSIRAFRESGQELQIRNAISNADPSVNAKVHEDMANHPEMFPDVNAEKLDTYKGQALSAEESHTRFQEWAEGQNAVKTKLVPLINLHTNAATGQFNEGEALKDIADGVASGKITPYQEGVLAEAVKSHGAELNVNAKQEAGKKLDAVEDLLTKHQFGAAKLQMEQDKGWFENNNLGEDHRAELHYMNQMESQQRAEASAARTESRYEYAMNRQVAQDQSQDMLGQVSHFISSGGILTKAQIQNMAGTGQGKMSVKDVDEAWKMMNAFQEQPDYKNAFKYINDSFQVSKDANADTVGAENKKYAETLAAFQDQVNKNPDKSKLQIAHDLVKSADEERIKDSADRMFGTQSAGKTFSNAAEQFFGISKPDVEGAKIPTRPQAVPSNYEWDASGNGGKGSWKAPKQ